MQRNPTTILYHHRGDPLVLNRLLATYGRFPFTNIVVRLDEDDRYLATNVLITERHGHMGTFIGPSDVDAADLSPELYGLDKGLHRWLGYVTDDADTIPFFFGCNNF